MSLNNVVLCGRLTEAGIKLTYLPSGQPEAKWTLVLEDPGKDPGQTWKMFIPVVAYGSKGEDMAQMLEPGDLVTVQGRLCWRTPAPTAKDPKPSGKLTVMAWQVERLSIHTHDPGENADIVPVEIVAHGGAGEVTPTKKGKPRYPRWKAGPVGSEN